MQSTESEEDEEEEDEEEEKKREKRIVRPLDIVNPKMNGVVEEEAKPEMATKGEKKGIKVICRIRPLVEYETKKTTEKCIEVVNEKTIHFQKKETNQFMSFSFGHVFGEETAQTQVFDQVGRPAIKHLLDGFNASIIAYGQTGSGKTYTMQGTGHADINGNWICDTPEENGIIPRTLTELFKQLANQPTVNTTVNASFIEIYMERVNDLISGTGNINIRGSGSVWVGATTVPVANPREVLRVMSEGLRLRKTASHDANSQSSRSHSIFVLTITQRDLIESTVKTSQLYLVDLAGSETVKKTNVQNTQLKEACNINTSLLALRKIIFALSDPKIKKKLKKNPNYYFGYRDSILTRILKNSLGGNAKSSIIINVSPSIYNDVETLSTLRFGQRSAKIKNRPTVNKKPSVEVLLRKLSEAQEELQMQKSLIKSLNTELYRYRHDANQEDNGDRLDPRLFYSFFICPLTRQTFIDPVIAMDGNTYERKALMKSIKSQRIVRSPMTGNPMHSSLMIPNLALRSQMHYFSNQFESIYDEVDYAFYWRPGNAIPNDIVTMIFSYLTADVIVTMGKVCTSWHECSRSNILWKNRVKNLNLSPEQLLEKLDKYNDQYYEVYWEQRAIRRYGQVNGGVKGSSFILSQ
mmetsp:Transcript_13282/g.20017  ORF Transcript_13282/g.20017 Transcript_13282/m.20017 type:complete len:637 (+) Transcript_13282:95-2005(+)